MTALIAEGRPAHERTAARRAHRAAPEPAALLPLRQPDREELEHLLAVARVAGRGGGGFPLSRKLTAMPRRGGDLVVNACEGDPLTAKDASLLAHDPGLVIDGALLLSRALRARRTVIAVHRGADIAALKEALARRADARRIEVLEVEPRYVASESSAVLSALRGGSGLPTDPNLRATDRARGHRPALVANAETVAQAALAVRAGTAALTGGSRGDESGTALVTVTGAVPEARVLELRDSDLIGDALRAAGARPEPGDLVLTGGATGTWVRFADLDRLPWGRESLRSVGGTRGTGALAVMPTGACVLAETLAILRFAARASAGQCGSCVFGLPALANDLADLLAGRDPRAALERLRRRCGAVTGRGGCGHPTATVATLLSALETIEPDHLAAHLAGRPCGGTGATMETLIGDAR